MGFATPTGDSVEGFVLQVLFQIRLSWGPLFETKAEYIMLMLSTYSL